MMISANTALTGSYDYSEVARSILIAIAASYAALDLTGRVTVAWGRVRLAWLSGGAMAMGIGIWAMHFKGMLAFRLPVPVEYHWPTVLASLLVAILASAVALYVAGRQKMGPVEALTGSVMMGAGIAGMHYIGMAAMRLPAVTQFSALLVTFSILFAILFSMAALLMAFDLREETKWTVPRRLGSAAVMGAAVSAMHYTGMAAVSFLPAVPPDLSHAVSISPLANNGIAIVTLIVIVAAMVTSSVDRRSSAEVQRLNEDLERRVTERTSQLEAVNQELRKEIAERKRAEEGVRRSEDRLRLVIDTLPALVWSKLPDGSADFLNQRFLEYTGLSVEEALGWGWMKEFDPEDRAEEEWRAAFAAGEPFEREAQLRRADGEYRWFLLRAVPLRDELGNVVKWYGTSTDIEERKRAEQELRQAEEHIRAILEYSPNWIFLKDTEGRYLLVNREIERVFGISQEQIKGKTDSEIFPPEHAPEYRANDLKVLRAGLTMEFEEIALLEDGPHTSIVHKFPLFDTHGNIYATGGVATDITERKRAEEARRYSEEQYRTVVETATDAVVSIDEDSKILFVNPATTKIFGYDTSELIGRPLMMLMPESLRKLHEAGFRRYLATGQRHLNWQGTELTGLRKNGQEFPVEVSFGEMISNGHKVFTGFIRDISEKKRAEDELRKQKELFQKIFENIPVLIAFRGKDRELQLVNPEWECTTGWKLEEIREQNPDILAEFFPDPHYRQVIRDLIAASTGQWNDIQLRARDGRVIDLASTFVHLSDGSTLFIGRDVTERKQAEEALRTSEREQHKIAEQLETERALLIEAQAVAKVGSWETELPSLDITWSEQTHRIFETDPSYFHPRRPGFVELVHPEDRAKVDAAFEASLKKGAPSTVEYRIVMADGRVKVLEEHWKVFHDGQGRPARLIGTCQDITERKRAERAVLRLAAIVESSDDAIISKDRNGVITSWNAGAQRMFGYTEAEVVGQSITIIIPPELQDEEANILQRLHAGEHIQHYETTRVTKQGKRVNVSLTISPIKDSEGRVVGASKIARDITERKQAELALREAQGELASVIRIATMGELTASIAHEINQPLAAVATNASASLRWLAVQPPNLDEARQAMANAMNEANRASGVIKRLRTLLQKTPPQLQAVNVNEVIRDVLALAHRELVTGGVTTRTELAPDLPTVFGDRVQLQQVMLNLIMNAIDAMSTVHDRPRTLLIKSKSATDAEGVVIEVQDSGKGLDPEQASRIFESFFTTKPDGIGMGLSISRSIVEAHGGRLRAEPGPSHGAVFQVILPKAA